MIKDYIGRIYGRRTIIDNGYNKGINADRIVKCKCECGKIKDVNMCSLRGGKTQSCGCIREEQMRDKQTIHGMNGTRINSIWNGIKTRCNNPKSKIYKHYGGRGITYDPKWETFLGFYEDMGPTYQDGLEIDRYPDNNSNYTKDNCRWTTHKENMQNYRKCHWFTFNGKTMNLGDWAKEIGKSESTILRRIKRGLPIELILSDKKRVK